MVVRHQCYTYKGCVSSLETARALLPPWPPQQEPQQVQHKHGGLGECAEEGLVVLLPLEYVLGKNRENTHGLLYEWLELKTDPVQIFF